MLAIAAKALQNKGVPAAELSQHVIALNVGQIITVISRPDAFTAAQWEAARTKLQAQGFKILLGPDVAYDAVTSAVMSGQADDTYFKSLPENVSPSTDDNPFFFYTARLGDFIFKPAMGLPNNNSAVSITLSLVLTALLACVYYIVVPYFRAAKRMPLSRLTPPVVYFSAIGMGFMLIEISQMQRLMVFLGHPVYGLGVVLFTILLFGGIGSTTVRAQPPSAGALATRVAALLSTLLIAGWLTPEITIWASSQPTSLRILVSVLLLAPPAFCMGMMFPLGLGIWRRHEDLLPFFWSANGITSMLASALGMALSIEFGIATTYSIGVGFYLICAAMIVIGWRANRQSRFIESPNLAGDVGTRSGLPVKPRVGEPIPLGGTSI